MRLCDPLNFQIFLIGSNYHVVLPIRVFVLQDAALAIHTLWGSPVFIIVVMALLYQQIQWACFVGLALMLVLAPLTGIVAKNLALLRRSTVQWTDKRTSIMSELINGMRVVKFYAWEGPFKCAFLPPLSPSTYSSRSVCMISLTCDT